MANSLVAFPTELQLPVEVIGCDLFGQQFFETTETLSISRSEVSILLNCKLAADAEVILRNPETNEEAIACVVGQLHEEGDGHVYGLVFLDPSVNLWHIKFPEATSAKMVQLACTTCHGLGTHLLCEAEVEICEAGGELTRRCEKCNSTALWRDPNRLASPKKPANASKQKPIPILAATPKEDRRKTRRALMTMTACVRYSGLEDVVTCEDISKGGFRFTGRKQYPEGTRVEVAVPYEDSTTNIFSPAVVKYCHPMPKGLFRHGVSHVKSSGSGTWYS
jgi:hypothetical protein